MPLIIFPVQGVLGAALSVWIQLSGAKELFPPGSLPPPWEQAPGEVY